MGSGSGMRAVYQSSMAAHLERLELERKLNRVGTFELNELTEAETLIKELEQCRVATETDGQSRT